MSRRRVQADSSDHDVLEILTRAVNEALVHKRCLGHYAVMWRDGRAVRVPPDELPVSKQDRAESSTHTRRRKMNRQEVLRLLEAHKAELSQRFGVTDMALFGSTARDTARADSDIDILVSFDGPATSARYFGVQFYLEDLLGRAVDLVTDKALRRELRPYVEQEAIHV